MVRLAATVAMWGIAVLLIAATLVLVWAAAPAYLFFRLYDDLRGRRSALTSRDA